MEEEVKKPEPVQYDPRKKYEWSPDAMFVLSGQEFGALLNGIRSIINTPEGRAYLMLFHADDVMEETLSRAVQAGTAKEKAPK